MTGLLGLEEAQAMVLALAAPLAIETIDIGAASGRYLTEPLVARRTQPAADLSAMDGYAVRASDVPGPWQIIGESAAGHPFAGTIGAGEAVRIATGALVPAGGDCVLVQEDCARDGATMSHSGDGPSPAGRHIRRKAMDFAECAALLPAGTRIGPAQIALAISAGCAQLTVHRRPRVTIIDTGDELATPGAPCPPHKIPASNGAMLGAMLAALPVDITRIGPLADDVGAIAAALAGKADVVVTSGGASVGEHDLLQPALARIGAETAFWKVAIKPGKPLLVARAGAKLILGLPGNPAASFVTVQLFVLPLLRRLLGAETCLPRRVQARLAGDLPPGGARREFRRAIWDGGEVRDGDVHDSGALASLAAANCLIDRPAHAAAARAGDAVSILPMAGVWAE